MTRGVLSRRTRLALILTSALALLGFTAGSASAATQTFTNGAGILLQDDAPAIPYPSNISVAGFAGNLQKATVTLHNFTHEYPDDLVVLLVGPGGQNSLLMGYVGGDTGDPQPFSNLTFDQSATATLNPDDELTSGTYRPSVDPSESPFTLSPPAPSGDLTVADLNVFNGHPANGTWSLFIEDQAGTDAGVIEGGWSVNLSAPVNTVTAGKPKLNKKKGTARIPVTVGDAGQLNLSGKGVKSASASKAVAVGGPGTTTLTVKPKGKTRKKLNSTGKAKVKVTITFTPNGGAPSVTTKKIKLKKTLKK
jgi:subtilisin-like proprotein convertase family protein